MTGLSKKGSCVARALMGTLNRKLETRALMGILNRKLETNLKTSSLTSSLNTGKCFLCAGSHLLFVCEKLLALSIADRIKEVKRLKLCINCLRNDHYVKACKRSSCRECNGRHNTLSSTVINNRLTRTLQNQSRRTTIIN